MKTRTFIALAAAGSLGVFQLGALRAAELSAGVAVEGNNAQPQPQVQVQADVHAAQAPAPSTGVRVQLSHGVDDVLKLCRGQVNEEVVVAFVHSSGTAYNLSANDIVYLKEQGVSDHIVNAMLEQRQRYLANNQTVTPANQAPAYTQPDNTQAQQPPVTYVQPPSSSVYVIPNTSSYGYYDSGYSPYYSNYGYPYYGGYYNSYYGGYPAFGLSFHFGDHGHGGYYSHGGYGHGGSSGGHYGGSHGGLSVSHTSGGFHSGGGSSGHHH